MFEKIKLCLLVGKSAVGSKVSGIFSRKPPVKMPTLEEMIDAEISRACADPAFTPEMAVKFRKDVYNAAMARALEGLGMNPAILRHANVDFSLLFAKRAA